MSKDDIIKRFARNRHLILVLQAAICFVIGTIIFARLKELKPYWEDMTHFFKYGQLDFWAFYAIACSEIITALMCLAGGAGSLLRKRWGWFLGTTAFLAVGFKSIFDIAVLGVAACIKNGGQLVDIGLFLKPRSIMELFLATLVLLSMRFTYGTYWEKDKLKSRTIVVLIVFGTLVASTNFLRYHLNYIMWYIWGL